MYEMMEWVRYSSSIGFSFEGRARRREYWWNFLYWELISCAIASAAQALLFSLRLSGADETAAGMLFSSLVSFASWAAGMVISIWKVLPITIRRFHDRGLSGWIYLACVVGSCCCGIGSIVGLVLCCLDSQPGTNQYGPNPKEAVINFFKLA